MAQPQGKDILSSDLDIFGEGTSEDTNEVGDEYDIFGGAADQKTTDANEVGEDPSEEATETTEQETAEESPASTDTDNDSDIDKTGDEILDIDIEHLFDDIETEAKGNPELEKLIDSLRDELVNKTTENNMLQKENSTLNEKLMSKVGDESNLGMYKGVITNLEDNPKLMMLVKHLGKSDSEAIKNKLVNVVTDILYDLTGEDVSDLINKDQSSKILSATGKNSSSAAPSSEEKGDDHVMDYEESISNLF